MHEIFILLLLVLTVLSNTVFAISCYSCESVFDEDCGEDNFEKESHFKLNCDDLTPPRFLESEIENLNSTACMKKVYIDDGERKVVRSCFFGFTNATMNSCTRDPTTDPVEEVLCHVCDDKSFCNGAERLSWALTQQLKVTLPSIILTVLFYYK